MADYLVDDYKNLVTPKEARVFKGTRVTANKYLSFDFYIADFTFGENIEKSFSWDISYSGRQLTSSITEVSVFINNAINKYVDILATPYFYAINYETGRSSTFIIDGTLTETLNPYGGTSVSFTPTVSYDSGYEFLMVLNVIKISYHS